MRLQKTKIEWVKNPDGTQGYSLNPIKGKCPMACPYCYARAMYDRFGWNPKPRWISSEMEKLRTLRKPSGIFMCSTFEWLWDESWAHNIYSWCKDFPQHRFYLLTKQPQNLIKFSPFPPNVYLGVTVTNQEMFDKAIYYLKMVDARVKFLSMEPLLNRIVVDNPTPK